MFNLGVSKIKRNKKKKNQALFLYESDLAHLLNFNEKIIFDSKKKKIFKIKDLTKKISNNILLKNNNKNNSGSSSDCKSYLAGKKVNFKKYLKCFYTNATSLNNKLSLLNAFMETEEPDAICVTGLFGVDAL